MKLENRTANALAGGGATLSISGLTATDGYVLTVQADGTLATEAAAAAGIGGSTGATDNALLRADGTGGSLAQNSGITVADAASGVAEMTSARIVRGQRVISSSPDTQLVSDDTLYFSAALTVDLLTSVTTGREFLYVCTAAATLTLDPGGTDTIDGGSAGAALAIPCAAGQAVRLIRSGSGAWRSVLPGNVNSTRVTITGGALVMHMGYMAGSAFTPIGDAISPTSSGDPNSFGATLSGTSLTVNAATAVSGNHDSTCQYWAWALPVTIPSTARWVVLRTEVSSHSEGVRTASSVSSVSVALGTGAQTAVRTLAWIRPGSGAGYNVGVIGGSGSFSTSTGQSTTVRWDMFGHVGDTLNGGVQCQRYDAGADLTATGQISSVGAIVATIPTYVMIGVQVTGANTTTSWTLNDLTCYVRW